MAGSGPHRGAGLAADLRRLPQPGRPGPRPGAQSGADRPRLSRLAAGQPALAAQRHAPHSGGDDRAGRIIRFPAAARPPGGALFLARTLAHCGLRGGPVPRCFSALRLYPHSQPGPVATLAGRREVHGHRLPQRLSEERLSAALRSLLRSRVPQLLLLRPVHRLPRRSPDRHHPHRGLQPGGAAVVCADGRECLLCGI